MRIPASPAAFGVIVWLFAFALPFSYCLNLHHSKSTAALPSSPTDQAKHIRRAKARRQRRGGPLLAVATTSTSTQKQQQKQPQANQNPATPKNATSFFRKAIRMAAGGILKNVSIPWVAVSGLMIWFLFVHSPPLLLSARKSGAFLLGDWPFTWHLVGAYAVSCICTINTLLTPSTFGGGSRPFHTNLGRIGLILGYLSFAFGAFCSWSPTRPQRPPLGFSVGITIGGLFQILYQWRGYKYIKRYQDLQKRIDTIIQETEPATILKYAAVDTSAAPLGEGVGHNDNPSWPSSTTTETAAAGSTDLATLTAERDTCLKYHIYNMCSLYAIGCGAPAMIRLMLSVFPPNLVPPSLIFFAAIMAVVSVVPPFAQSYLSDGHGMGSISNNRSNRNTSTKEGSNITTFTPSSSPLSMTPSSEDAYMLGPSKELTDG